MRWTRISVLVLLSSCAVGASLAFVRGPLLWLELLAIAVLVALILPIRWQAVPWWMNPWWALVLGVAPGVALATLVSNDYFLSHWDEPKLFATRHLALTTTLVLAFVVGSLIGARALASRTQITQLQASSPLLSLLERSTRILFWVTIGGYLIWLALGLTRGLNIATIVGTLEGDAGAFYTSRNDVFAPVAGVTTLTQFGPLVVTLMMVLRRLGSRFPTAKYLIPLGVMTFIRAVLHGERLGILELLIPMAVVACALPRGKMRNHRALVALFPVWLPVGLLIFFGAFEYSRSWSHYRYQYANDGFVSFTFDRLGGYYATASNNSALLLSQDTGNIPYWTFQWFWNLPGMSFISPSGVTDAPNALAAALAGQANPEYNNPGGILVPVVDLGIPGAILFWSVSGVAVGVVFSLFRRRALSGVILYPVLFIGLLEGGRVLYWTSGRAIPSLAGALLLVGLSRDLALGSDSRRTSSTRRVPRADPLPDRSMR